MAARHSNDKPVSIRPDLVRVRPPLSTQQIIGQLEQLSPPWQQQAPIAVIGIRQRREGTPPQPLKPTDSG